MSKVNPDKYITIQGWMVSDLHLKGTELLVYAIIYGFSQDDESWFQGSRQYLADWCGCSVRSIQTTLNNLVDSKLLIKAEEVHNGIKYCSYATNFTGGENFSRGGENLAHYNIVYNNSNSNLVSKDTKLGTTESSFDFGKPKTSKPKKKTNEDEYLDACLLIDNFTDNKEQKTLLKQLLGNRLDMCSKERHHFYASTFKNYLDELKTINDVTGSIKLSLQYNNTLKVMEPNISVSKSNSVFCETAEMKNQKKFNPDDIAKDENGNALIF